MTPTIQLPMRARKLAQAKQALLAAAVERLDHRTLDEIPVQELCDAAQVSPASFFNYFPKKSDLIVYFIRLWSLDLGWRARRDDGPRGARAAIDAIFAATAERVREHPGLMAEILVQQARLTAGAELPPLTVADRVVAYPDRPGIEALPAEGLDSLLPPLIARAIADGELPAATDRRAAFLGLTSIFFGVPLVLRRRDPAAVGDAYRQQLDLLWAGLRSIPARSIKRRRRS